MSTGDPNTLLSSSVAKYFIITTLKKNIRILKLYSNHQNDHIYSVHSKDLLWIMHNYKKMWSSKVVNHRFDKNGKHKKNVNQPALYKCEHMKNVKHGSDYNLMGNYQVKCVVIFNEPIRL